MCSMLVQRSQPWAIKNLVVVDAEERCSMQESRLGELLDPALSGKSG